ncbi:MAG TPA: T9SS type A sorting domain-containing protein [Ignavibacteria bacterium]
MKKVVFLLLIIQFSLIIANAQSGWVESPTGVNRAIRDIYFVNANTGWGVGDSTIIKSTNSGLNWTRQYFYYLGITASFNTVKFLNENTGYIAGGHSAGFYDFYYQYIFKTTNGGSNWNLLYNNPGGANSAISKIFLLNENNIYLTMAGSYWNAASGGVYKSTNGGLNFSLCISKGESNSIFFIDANTGWVNSYFWTDVPIDKGYILKTTNGGLNWTEQYKDSLDNATHIYSIQFINQNTGFAIGSKFYNNKTKFFKTTDGGVNWDTVFYSNGKNKSLFFINQNTGWIGGFRDFDSSSISYTTDGGLNWTSQKNNYLNNVINIFFINNLTGWAALAYSSNILRTTNGGVTFISEINGKLPVSYSLGQNYPNPFNPTTKIKFDIAPFSRSKSLLGGGAGGVLTSLKVFDITGREIQILVNEKLNPGTYEVTFDGSNYASGVYFYQLRSGDFIATKKLILLK